jgi:hypothetical protein
VCVCVCVCVSVSSSPVAINAQNSHYHCDSGGCVPCACAHHVCVKCSVCGVGLEVGGACVVCAAVAGRTHL